MGFYASSALGGLGKAILDWLEWTVNFGKKKRKKRSRKQLFLKIDEFALNLFSSGVKQMAEVIVYQVIYMPLGIKRLLN